MDDTKAWKVSYRTSSGYDSTAYVDIELDKEGNVLRDVPFPGTNKHSDYPLRLKWTGDEWLEVEL